VRLRLRNLLLEPFRLLARLLPFRALAEGVMIGAFQFAQLPSELLDFSFRALHFGRKGFGISVYLLLLALQGVQNGGARPALGRAGCLPLPAGFGRVRRGRVHAR
jgi:hypothetical protein